MRYTNQKCTNQKTTNQKKLAASRINTSTKTMKINITINVKENNFNPSFIETLHNLDSQQLYKKLCEKSEYYNSAISSPDLLKTDGGLNPTHLKQQNKNHDFFLKLRNDKTTWNVTFAPRRGYTAYIFTIE